MITPMRFGLKYAPVPTLALEYEEDLRNLEDETGTRSLYIYREIGTREERALRRKKIHVVELPHLTGASEPTKIVAQLQRDNERFLGPQVVKEEQLRRLLRQLVDHLQRTEPRNGDADANGGGKSTEPPTASSPQARDEQDDSEDDGLEESVLEESNAEVSGSMNASHRGDDVDPPPLTTSPPASRGQFITQDQSDDEAVSPVKPGPEDDRESTNAKHKDLEKVVQPGSPLQQGTKLAVNAVDPESDREEDTKIAKEQKTESEANSDEEIQSEELEYFSEDGSDEDSF